MDRTSVMIDITKHGWIGAEPPPAECEKVGHVNGAATGRSEVVTGACDADR
jgi:hypothetical protein